MANSREQGYNLGITQQVCKIWSAFDYDRRVWLTIGDIAGYTGITRDTLKDRANAMVRAGLLERSEDMSPYTYRRKAEDELLEQPKVLLAKIKSATEKYEAVKPNEAA